MIISWNKFVRRSSSIATICNLDDFQIKPRFSSNILKLINYLIALVKSGSIIWANRKKNNVLVLALPPNFLLYLIGWIRLSNKRTKIIADCHNGTFSKKWMSFPGIKYLLYKVDLVLVHNEDFYNQLLKDTLISSKNSLVIPDPPAISGVEMIDKDPSNRTIVFPASFSKDEPISELIECLSDDSFQNLNCTLFITGPSYKLDASKLRELSSIKNVEITGFLERKEYENLLKNSVGILALTKFEKIQLSATNEAVGYLSIPIYSKTVILEKMYHDVGLPVNKNLSDFNLVLRSLLSNTEELMKNIVYERKRRYDEWRSDYSHHFGIKK